MSPESRRERRERVEYVVDGDHVVGHLYLPSGEGPHPATVVGGPMTSVKEQVTGVYARALAERGVAALSIDPRHYGESGGTPRQYELYQHKIEDLRGGLDYLATRPDIASARLGAIGVCLGTGYALWAAVGHPRVAAVGGVAGYYRDPTSMRAKDPEGFAAKVAQGVAAREHYERTGEVQTVPAVALEGDAAMTLKDTFDYYGTARAGVPNYTNAFAVMSREHFLPFDVQAVAPKLGAPLLMLHSETALSPHWARQFYAAVNGPKAIEWTTSKGQTDFYDDPRLVSWATERLAKHLRAHL